MTVALKHEVVVAHEGEGHAPKKSMLFLPGILGTGTNLRSLAKRFVAQRPDWQGVLVDLRAHGGSLERDGSVDSVASAGDDVVALAASLPVPVHAVTAHSFGGKVALDFSIKTTGPLEHVTLIDSGPGTRRDFRGSEATVRVIAMLDELAGVTFASRDAFVREVMARGQDRGTALWLAMSVEVRDGQFRFALDLKRIHALLDSYFSLDAWAAIETSRAQVHVVIGERSGVFDEADRARVRRLEQATGGRVSVDVLPAGHWVHVDDFEGLLRVLVARVM